MSMTDQGRAIQEPATATSNAPAELPPVPRKGRRWFRILAFGFLATLLFVAFVPHLISWSTLRHHLPRFRLPGFEEEIRVGRASLSWWGPIELWDLELYAPDGKPFIRIGHIREDRSVWRLVTHPTEAVHVRMDRPEVTVLLRPDGDNIQDALAPVFGHPKRQRRERSLEVVDGVVRVTDTANGRTVVWKNVGVKADMEPDATTPNRVHVSAELADAPEAEPLHVDFAWSSAPQEAGKSFGPWKGSVETANLPLAALGPLLGRISPDLDLSGTVSADLRLHSSNKKNSAGGSGLSGDCRLATKDLQVTWPSRLGEDRPELAKAGVHVQFAPEAAGCRVEQLTVVTDLCRLDGGGVIPAALQRLEEGPAPGANFSLRGALDLVALVRMLPNTLPMREGAELTDGKLKFELTSLAQDERMGWTGRIETTRLAAEIGGEQVEWDQPLMLTFDLHQGQRRIEVDSLECRSDLLRVTGRGNSDGAHFEAGCDLERLAARLGQFFDAGGRQMRGKLTVAADLSRDAEGAPVVEARADLENLLVRHLERRMVERRRGDIQPVEFVVPAGPPALLPGQVLDRKAMQARKRAEREAEKEARRNEKEARKKAEEIVMVPIEEWKTVWSEPRMTLSGQGRFLREKNVLELPRLEAVADGLSVQAKGRLTNLFAQCRIDMEGETAVDMQQLVYRLQETVGPHLQLAGNERRRFSVHGPLRSAIVTTGAPTLISPEMQGAASVGWKKGDLFGLQSGKAEFDLALADGVVTMRPVAVDVSGGKLNLAGRALLNDGPARVVLPAGTLIDDVELTDEVCETWLKFIAPILSQATRAAGRFSVDLDETRVPFADPAAADLSGRLTIVKGQVLPGPLFTEIGGLVSNIVSAASGTAPRDFLGLDTPLVRIGRQDVKFKLHERRIYHSPVEFDVRNMVIRTRGSVGLDQTLDIVAEITFSDDLLARAKFLSQFRERPLVLRIQGTLRKPRVDPQVVGRFAAQFGQNAVEGLINQGLKKLLEREK